MIRVWTTTDFKKLSRGRGRRFGPADVPVGREAVLVTLCNKKGERVERKRQVSRTTFWRQTSPETQSLSESPGKGGQTAVFF